MATNSDKYSLVSLRELGKLIKLANAREAEYKLKESTRIMEKWTKGSIQTNEAFGDMSSLFTEKNSAWSDRADPGVLVAHAVVQGYLRKEDISPDTWDKIEMLITITKI